MADMEGLQISGSIRTKYVIIHDIEPLITAEESVPSNHWRCFPWLLLWYDSTSRNYSVIFVSHFMVHEQFILCFWATIILNPLATTTISQFYFMPSYLFMHRGCVIIFHCVYSHRNPLLSWDGGVLISYHGKQKMKVYWHNYLELLKYIM